MYVWNLYWKTVGDHIHDFKPRKNNYITDSRSGVSLKEITDKLRPALSP